MNLQIYDRSFEREFLKATEHFYREESSLQIQELNVCFKIHKKKIFFLIRSAIIYNLRRKD